MMSLSSKSLRHAHEFTELPSERGSKQSQAAKVMLRLVEQATMYGTFSHYIPAERRKRDIEKIHRALAQGEEVKLTYETRPGAFIASQSEEVRAVLRELTAHDVSEVQIDLNSVHDWEMGPPGQRFKFGPNSGVHETRPRVFVMSPSNTK